MSGVAIDASALIAYLRREPGAEVVAEHLRGSVMSAVNLTEVFENALKRENAMERVAALLRNWSVKIVAHDAELAEIAARLKPVTDGFDLSLADRACLALAKQRSIPVVTANRAWRNLPIDVEVILIRRLQA